VFGARAVGTITVTDCEQLRANLLATLRPRTVRTVWQMLDRVLEYAYEHKAIGAVPTDVIDRAAVHYAVADDTAFTPHPLTAPQAAAWRRKWVSVTPSMSYWSCSWRTPAFARRKSRV
jgi:hypothetical protein